ncbi:NRDE protein-domain-containing protein [Mucor lusitanicus]|uniref:NRDE protein-domain-containing protein n=1 Tax=Mucor circinelloides f. lusitanicus TaxID=29924 RepID=A0A8H4BSA2_MUCCL|nr:NRDE protein-domain-containing protein [Mucor lusitanicus]
MCILFWTVNNHPKYRFIFAGNRDEFLRRPTARAHFWEPPFDNVLAGTDLEKHPDDVDLKNGTWLGITKEGRFSALTNYRESNFRGKVSRGVLVRDFLCDKESVHDSVEHLQAHTNDYGGFSLVNFDFSKKPADMAYVTNREDQSTVELKPGEIYGLSNSILTNPWPKVKMGKEVFQRIIQQHDLSQQDLIDALFGLLSLSKPMNNDKDIQQIFDDLKERISIPLFNFPGNLGIQEPAYATRTSTIVLIDRDDNVTFIERLWYNETDLSPVNPGEYNDLIFQFSLEHE